MAGLYNVGLLIDQIYEDINPLVKNLATYARRGRWLQNHQDACHTRVLIQTVSYRESEPGWFFRLCDERTANRSIFGRYKVQYAANKPRLLCNDATTRQWLCMFSVLAKTLDGTESSILPNDHSTLSCSAIQQHSNQHSIRVANGMANG